MAGSDLICESAPVPADGQPNCVHAFTDTGVQSVEITVTDTRLDRQCASSTVNILDNEPPLITIVSPEEGDLFSIDDLIVFEAAVSDAEESPENLVVSVNSSIDGEVELTGTPSSSGEWTAGGYLSSGVHLLTFWVEDSFGLSDQDTVSIEVYEHGPPSASSVNITPSPAYTIDDLAADVQGWTDMEGGPEQYRYTWYISDETGTLVEDSSETTGAFPYGKTTRGDLVQVEVTPYNEYGDGDMLTSPTITIENSPPSAPVLLISPTSPQPEENLLCTIVVNSADDDGDAITYDYTWYKNGTEAGEYSTVITADLTTHGDTWECVVTPNDGVEMGDSASDSVNVLDTLGPDAPQIDQPTSYRNDEDITLTGTCESGCLLTYYCSDSATSWTDTGTCDATGNFEYPTTLNRGEVTSCNADCEDSAGNISGISNTVDIEVCDPADEYEDSTGYGDSSTNPIDEWTALSDDGSTTLSISGNILDDDSEDWFILSTSDVLADDITAGIDYYNFSVNLIDGTSDYAMVVYKGGLATSDLECSSSGYTEYNDMVEDTGDGSHVIPSDSRACGVSDEDFNDCEDMSNDYYIHVFRRSATVSSCQAYELEITNGVW